MLTDEQLGGVFAGERVDRECISGNCCPNDSKLNPLYCTLKKHKNSRIVTPGLQRNKPPGTHSSNGIMMPAPQSQQ